MSLAEPLADDVQVWWLRLDEPELSLETCRAVLSEAEQARAAAFLREPPRRRFCVARCGLRLLLGRYLGLAPKDVGIDGPAGTKPVLAPIHGPSEWRFNLTHSGNLVLYAFARSREVGIDVEELRQVPEADRIVRRFFAASEREAWQSLPGELRQASFFRAWTQKEALLKAWRGEVATPLGFFEVALPADSPPRVVSFGGDVGTASRWSLADVEVAAGYTASLAAEGPRLRHSVRPLDPRALTRREESS